jgi:hypothetical protein
MRIKLLEVVHYQPDGVSASGSGWDAIGHRFPDWASIQSAIRQLDRNEHAFIWLHITQPVDGDVPENALCIMGGRGEYSLFLSRDSGEVYYCDESRVEASVRIWESDQGSVTTERNLCNHLPTVLLVAKHFAESGELLPEVRWEEW